ncbi:META domain-containing protein [Streptomyces endophyticus]|uniref:META domain-containing protein n=1 Tax=Streptomyces endophyticus TaxID=714166 RepID=A0ABU6FBA2_9ACTN|nr:META domain-containing protein [Streptomyces endophyticus]MEB8341320.1 META domain-containing protein [Streptomyces endophyticus]
MLTLRTSRTRALISTAALPLAALATVTACGNEKAPGAEKAGGAPITGVHWSVQSVTVDGRTTKAPGSAYLEFVSDERVRGNYGCNHFDAEAAVTGDSVDLGKAKRTMMLCEGKDVRSFEDTLARALADKNTLRAAGEKNDRLTLTRANGDTVTLAKQRDAELAGTKWNVTSLSADDATRSLPKAAQGRARLVFEKDGHVSARLGCNQGRAEATVKEGHITFGPLTSTRMGCIGAAGEVEQAMLDVLKNKATYDIQGDALTLKKPDGTGIGLTAADSSPGR